ncbi:MAG TPA: hypothetical protein DEB09_01950 [Candidatus Magasanikbacteria bacterium]|nr:hypothetical protein [Candidatus Magasanikbacteria bacterium]
MVYSFVIAKNRKGSKILIFFRSLFWLVVQPASYPVIVRMWEQQKEGVMKTLLALVLGFSFVACDYGMDLQGPSSCDTTDEDTANDVVDYEVVLACTVRTDGVRDCVSLDGLGGSKCLLGSCKAVEGFDGYCATINRATLLTQQGGCATLIDGQLVVGTCNPTTGTCTSPSPKK